MDKEKSIRFLVDLPAADLALLDSVKERMGLSSRGRVLSTLLQALVDFQPATVELARKGRDRTKVEAQP